MNRDLRVGLSLSLLVLGVAGAFCFRVDPVALDAPAEAADEIADEVSDGADAHPGPPAAGPPPEPVKIADADPAETKKAVRVSRKKRAKPAGPPPPPVPRIGPPPVAVVSAEPPPTAPALLKPEPEPAPEPAAGPRFYTIKPGDTLSGVAERELGSHRKYHAIFEANRDVLASPDALRVGMTLRLPDAASL